LAVSPALSAVRVGEVDHPVYNFIYGEVDGPQLEHDNRPFTRLMAVHHHRPSPFPRLSRAMGSKSQRGSISILMGWASSYGFSEKTVKLSRQVIH
ncbi:hypothetical protein, partial, partial [Absidia glauca]